MGSKTTTTANYGFFQKPNWAELDTLKAWNPQADPTIGYNFGRQRQDLERSFVSPTGSYQTPELREQQMRSGIENIGQNEAQARRADMYDQNQMNLGKLTNIAQMKAPEFAKTSEEAKQKNSFWGSLAGGLLGVGSSFLGAKFGGKK